MHWETVRVSREDALRIRRVYRKLAKMRGRGVSTPGYGVHKARERGEVAGIPGVSSGGVAERQTGNLARKSCGRSLTILSSFILLGFEALTCELSRMRVCGITQITTVRRCVV